MVDKDDPKLTAAERVTLLNVVALPETVAVALNAMVPVPAVKVPLLTKLPEMVSVLELPCNVPPLVTVLAEADPSTVTVTPEGITTSVVEVGTPPHQLDPVVQLPEAPPIQVPADTMVTVTLLDTVAVPPVGVEVQTT